MAIAEREPSPSQRRAIEADPKSLLVLAGPGAGKTFCLTERIRFLIETHHFDPARICAFTFTNKAAGEIAHRLGAALGGVASHVQRGTIHAFCAGLLREFSREVGLEPGFGIADEDYQLAALRRIEGPRRWHRSTLTRFAGHRFRGDPLQHDDLVLFGEYERFLAERNLVDFDLLVLKAAQLVGQTAAAPLIRARWDVVLVDEFQDLNPVQYSVVRALAADHRHIFAVGDDEQSIYSWAGADPAVFTSFVNDFNPEIISLEENRRCPSDVFQLARNLVTINTPIFAHKFVPRADRTPTHPVRAIGFGTDDNEAAWIIDDLRSDRSKNGHGWGDVALLYRKHEIGDHLETAFLNAGIPCRLAQGRALADDPVVGYVIAALRVISNPADELFTEALFRAVLPRPLFDEAQAKAEENQITLRNQLRRMAGGLPRGDERARQIRRAIADGRNLEAIGKQHDGLTTLVQELLSHRVGRQPSTLDEHHDEITDPETLPDVVALAARLRKARADGAEIRIGLMDGVDIAVKGMLAEIGVRSVRSARPGTETTEWIGPDDTPSVGIALGVFKAAQLIEMADSTSTLTSFTAIDLETTDNDRAKAEIVEVAAVRVRDGKIVAQYSSLVKPSVPISAGAIATHGIAEAEVAGAPTFAEIWPKLRMFCGEDVVVAHNGYHFDFPILERMAKSIGSRADLCTFDSLPLSRELFLTSRRLPDLARHFGVDVGKSHRALDDTMALAQVLLHLGVMKVSRARKTALVGMLDHLGIALALSRENDLGAEAQLFQRLSRVFALGRYSDCLEWYQRELGDDLHAPSVEQVIERLGGAALMTKIRSAKTADERYPVAMRRLRRLIAEIPRGSLGDQLSAFLERVVLSKFDGDEPDRDRVNLLTLHSTKGLEFSRVYIVGAEDAQLPGAKESKKPSQREVEEARRLLYVGMTRTIDRLVLTNVTTRGDAPTLGHQFLDEMGMRLEPPA